MELDPTIGLLLLWGAVALVGRLFGRKPQKPPRPRPTPPPGEPGTATQRKPESFAEMLEMMREQMEAAQDPEPIQLPDPEGRGTATASLDDDADEDEDEWSRYTGLPSAEEVEERESLEIEPEIISLEVPARRHERVVDDHRKSGQAAISRRLTESAARNRGWTLKDHQEFDARIRSKPATATKKTVHRSALRRAVVWREILGPPVGLHDTVER